MSNFSWEHVIFQMPPTCCGQIVATSYGCDDNGFVYRKTIDGSDRTITIDRSRVLNGDNGDYQNGEPGNKRWKELYRGKIDDFEDDE